MSLKNIQRLLKIAESMNDQDWVERLTKEREKSLVEVN